MIDPRLLSIQVGLPQNHGFEGASDPLDHPWRSGFFKFPISGSVRVNFTGLDGDGQADLENHGGPDKAVLAYSADHYPAWRNELHKPDLPFGAFGENLTVTGLTENEVCIGDQWRVGEILFEVSQPRLPCWKLARRWRIKDLALQVERNGKSGWYLRAISEGVIEPGLEWTLVTRPNPDWTIARANQIWLRDKTNVDAATTLRDLPALAGSWKKMLANRLSRLQSAT